MTHMVDYSKSNPMLARLAVRDMKLSEADKDILKEIADMPGSNGEDFARHIRRMFPGWEGRSASLPALLEIVKSGVDLDD